MEASRARPPSLATILGGFWEAAVVDRAITLEPPKVAQSSSEPLTSVSEPACAQAGLDATTVQFEHVCAGFSGGPGDKADYLRELVRSQGYDVTTDAVIALAGATSGDPGMICIAGTGSIAYGRNASRKFARVGWLGLHLRR